jgi:hypothetical protein
VHNIYDANDKAHRYGAPELIHGFWYCYCEDNGIYHALMSNVELAEKFSVSPVKQKVENHRSGKGRGRLMLVRPTISVPDNVS